MKTLGFSLLIFGIVLAVVPATAQGDTAFTLTTHTAGADISFQNLAGAKNPTLNVPANTQVSITIRNADGGFHNLALLAPVSEKSADVSADGDEETLTFTTPASGTIKYQCDYHASTMFGNVVVAGSTVTPTGDDKKGSPGIALVGVSVAMLGAALLMRRK